MDTKKIEDIYNRTFGGLTLFYRDTDLSDKLISKYQIGQIINERGFTDMSYKGGGLKTNLRYLIASANGKDLSALNADSARFGHIILKSNSFFKVLDISKIDNKTQVFILEIPEDSIDFFTKSKSNIEDDIIKKAKESFNSKINNEAIPELQLNEWKQRVEFPIGMSKSGDFFYQNDIQKNTKTKEKKESITNIKETKSDKPWWKFW